MGCDIHLYTEKKIKYGDETFWWCCDFIQMNPYHMFDKEEPEYDHCSIYNNRSYSLFEILADVRSCGHEVVMDQPRGLPEDASYYVQEQADEWKDDGHSYSWFTAKELFDYDKKYPDSALKPLVKAVKKKMKMEFCIWDFLSKEEKKNRLKMVAEDFRIVFWFDN